MSNYLNKFSFSGLSANCSSINQSASPDQLIGYIHKQKFTLSNRININYQNNSIKNLKSIKKDKEDNIILIILESPHISEFVNGQCIGTMMNKTTVKNFENKIVSLLLNSSLASNFNNTCKKYNIIIMNSVQYQCSLGQPLSNYNNKKVRDENWIELYNNGCHRDLIDRIELIKPQIIINLCTKGLKNLQLILDRDLNDFCKMYNIQYTYGSHPSSWIYNRFIM